MDDRDVSSKWMDLCQAVVVVVVIVIVQRDLERFKRFINEWPMCRRQRLYSLCGFVNELITSRGFVVTDWLAVVE